MIVEAVAGGWGGEASPEVLVRIGTVVVRSVCDAASTCFLPGRKISALRRQIRGLEPFASLPHSPLWAVSMQKNPVLCCCTMECYQFASSR